MFRRLMKFEALPAITAVVGCLAFVLSLGVNLAAAPGDVKDRPIKEVEELDLTGLWRIDGTETDGEGKKKPYAGVCILRKVRDGYECQWTVGVNVNAVGVGYVENNVLVACWRQGDAIGVNRYNVKDAKTLDGKWLSNPHIKWKQEKLTWIGTLPQAAKSADSEN